MTNASPSTPSRPAWFDQKLMAYMPYIKKWSRRMERNAQERMELVSETATRAMERWDRYRTDGNFPVWLWYIMREIQQTKRNAARRMPIADALPEQVTPPAQEHAVQLRQVMALVPERRRSMAYRLAIGFSQAEISAQDGVTAQRTSQKVIDVRRSLRKAA